MKQKTLLIAAVYLITTNAASAADPYAVTSEVIDSSIQINGDKISYLLENSLGGNDYLEFDFADGRWLGITADQDFVGGNISASASEEYSVNGWQIPCFTNPWAFAGCIVFAGIAQQICDSRQRVTLQRLQSQCGPRELAEISEASGCGYIKSFGCREINLEDDQGDDGVDG